MIFLYFHVFRDIILLITFIHVTVLVRLEFQVELGGLIDDKKWNHNEKLYYSQFQRVCDRNFATGHHLDW